MDIRIYQIALSLLHGVGPTTGKQLVNAVGSLEGVFKEKASNFRHFHGLRIDFSRSLEREKALIRAEQELAFIERNNIQLYYYQDANYPHLLKQCDDAPIVLFCKGKVDFNQTNISIVGTRKVTAYGQSMTEKIVGELAPYQVQIISGLAHGVDRYAHESAIRNELSTLGILGHGLDSMYPAAHRKLAEKMMENGGLVTEFVSGVIGDPSNFPRRNRIVAGLSAATAVIESSQSGGSMITANLANDYNRDVFAIPGNLNSNSSSGCNNLIRRHKAQLLTSGEDIAQALGWDEKERSSTVETAALELMTEEEGKVFHAIKENGEIDADSLVMKSGLGVSELSLHLFNLEIRGSIKSLPGKRYALA